MTDKPKADNNRQNLITSAGDLRLQLNLLDACLAVGRDDWAAQVIGEINRLSNPGSGLILPSGVTAAPAAKPGGRKPWNPASPEKVKQIVLNMIGERPMVS